MSDYPVFLGFFSPHQDSCVDTFSKKLKLSHVVGAVLRTGIQVFLMEKIMTHNEQHSSVSLIKGTASCAKLKGELSPFEVHRILRLNELCELIGRSKSMVYEYLNPTSKYYNPNFPKPVKTSARSNGWRAVEVYAYIDSLGA